MVRASFLLALCLVSISVARAEQVEWSNLPRMQLERQFAGPLQDTTIQRWRDPVDGSICYIYLPFSVATNSPQPGGYRQYGAATIGSISCTPGRVAEKKPAPAPKKPVE